MLIVAPVITTTEDRDTLANRLASQVESALVGIERTLRRTVVANAMVERIRGRDDDRAVAYEPCNSSMPGSSSGLPPTRYG